MNALSMLERCFERQWAGLLPETKRFRSSAGETPGHSGHIVPNRVVLWGVMPPFLRTDLDSSYIPAQYQLISIKNDIPSRESLEWRGLLPYSEK